MNDRKASHSGCRRGGVDSGTTIDRKENLDGNSEIDFKPGVKFGRRREAVRKGHHRCRNRKAWKEEEGTFQTAARQGCDDNETSRGGQSYGCDDTGRNEFERYVDGHIGGSPSTPHLETPDVDNAVSRGLVGYMGASLFGGVGRFVEDVAVSLDDVIGRALDDWSGGGEKRESRDAREEEEEVVYDNDRKRVEDGKSRRRNGDVDAWNDAGGEDDDAWGDFYAIDGEYVNVQQTLCHEGSTKTEPRFEKQKTSSAKESKNSPSSLPHQKQHGMRQPTDDISSSQSPDHLSTPHIGNGLVRVCDSMTHDGSAGKSSEETQWKKKALMLLKEVKKLRMKCAEHEQFRKDYEDLKYQLHAATQRLDSLSAEDSSNKQTTPTQDEYLAAETDSVDQQTTYQIEILLADKAVLSQENDRLQREVQGLQELLDVVMASSSWNEDGSWDDDDALHSGIDVHVLKDPHVNMVEEASHTSDIQRTEGV